MCGIAGAVAPRLAAGGVLREAVAGMVDRLLHRGPDGHGVVEHGPAALGSARLAVVDPRPRPMPFESDDGRWVLAYNGEVYNHRELRAELERAGVRFATNTDTEVVLEALRAWGREALPRLQGQYAFVALDRQSGHLIGGRDRLGQKPFFYVDQPGLFAFASFLPCFHALPGFEPTIDQRGIFDVVELGYLLHPKTPYREVRQLPPAHGFTWADGRMETFRYWDLAAAFRRGAEEPAPSAGEAGERLMGTLRAAVDRRRVADVPLGALLSGGIDSAAIVALMSELSPQRVKTFCLGFDDPSFDERSPARLVAEHLGTEHHDEVAHLDVEGTLLPALWQVGEPLADTSVLPTSLVSKMARQHVKVVLTGDGGDELLAGYETFRADRVRQLLHRLPAFPARTVLRALAHLAPVDQKKLSWSYRLRRFASGVELPEADAHYHWRALQGHAEAVSLFLPDARRDLDGYTPVERFRSLDAELAGLDLVNRCSYVDLNTYLVDDILVKVDRCSMAWGLEGRNPFLDHEVVETVAAMPGRYKLRGKTTKWILRERLAGKLPPSILSRPKQGFSAPVSRWLLGPLRDVFHDLVTPGRLEPLGLDAGAARAVYGQLERKERFAHYALWSLLVLGAWSELRTRPTSP